MKYEPYKRNKAILTLLWDFNARPHGITLMRIISEVKPDKKIPLKLKNFFNLKNEEFLSIIKK